MPRLGLRYVSSPQGLPLAPAAASGAEAIGALGQLGRVLEQGAAEGLSVYDAEQRAKARAASSRALRELQDFSLNLTELEPDYNRHEQLFEEKRREVLDRYRGTIATQEHADLFDEDARARSDRIGWNVQAQVRQRQVDGALAALDEAEAAELEAVLADPTVGDTSLGKLEIMWEEQTRAGTLRQQDRVARREAWRKAASGAGDEALRRELAAARVVEIVNTATSEAEAERMALESDPQIAALVAREARAIYSARRARVNFAEASAERAEREAAATAYQDGMRAALRGGLTPEKLDELAPALRSRPDSFARLAGIVAKGGRLEPGPPDPAYYRYVTRLRAARPRAFAEADLDPARLGTQFEEITRAQGAILAGGPDPLAGNLTMAAERWNRLKDRLADVPYWPFDEDEAVMEQLEGEFFIRVDEAQRAYYEGPGNGKNAVGDEFEKLLDGVVLSMAKELPGRGGEALVSGRGAFRGRPPAPPAPEALPVHEPRPRGRRVFPLEGISTENVERVRASIEARQARGEITAPVTDELIRSVYDQLVEQGALAP